MMACSSGTMLTFTRPSRDSRRSTTSTRSPSSGCSVRTTLAMTTLRSTSSGDGPIDSRGGQDVAREVQSPHRCLANGLRPGAQRVGRVHALEHQLAVPGDHGEDVAEVVGHAAGQAAERLEPPGVLQLVLEPLPLRALLVELALGARDRGQRLGQRQGRCHGRRSAGGSAITVARHRASPPRPADRGTAASAIRKIVPPPGAPRKSMTPPWSSMILCVRASPSPVPLSFVLKNGLNTRSVASGAMPTPLSSTSICTRRRGARTPAAGHARCRRVPAQPTRSTRRPPAGIASRALRTRLTSDWWSASASAQIAGRSRAYSRLRRDAAAVQLVRAQVHHALQQHRQPDGREGQARGPGQLEQPLDDAVDALQLVRDDRLELLAELLVVEAAA